MKVTTKAAQCPKCKRYHLISAIELFNSDRETRKEFADYVMEGFSVVGVTTEEAITNYGYCEDLPKPTPNE